VIAGQGTAALELLAETPLDAIVVPVGGGGLAAGTALAIAGASPSTTLYLAEPAGAAETAASLARGERVTDFVPDTICDGLRGTLGAINFAMLQAHGAQALVVDDAATLAAMRLAWTRMKQLIEPSSAVALAAVLSNPALFEGRRVGVVLSGGNVDLHALVNA
jgi:threonine dehydratase